MQEATVKKYAFSIISIIASISSIIGVLIINHNLAVQYLSSDGKTKALYGIIELSKVHYKFWTVGLGVIAIVFVILASRKKEPKSMVVAAFGLSLISIVLVFIPLWKFMLKISIL